MVAERGQACSLGVETQSEIDVQPSVSSLMEQKVMTQGIEQQTTTYAREYVMRVETGIPEIRDSIFALMEKDLISSPSVGELKELNFKMKGVSRILAEPGKRRDETAGCDKRMIVVNRPCVDQRRGPRRRSEEGEEQEQDWKLRREEQWTSIRRGELAGEDRRRTAKLGEELAKRLEVRAEESREMWRKWKLGLPRLVECQPCSK